MYDPKSLKVVLVFFILGFSARIGWFRGHLLAVWLVAMILVLLPASGEIGRCVRTKIVVTGCHAVVLEAVALVSVDDAVEYCIENDV